MLWGQMVRNQAMGTERWIMEGSYKGIQENKIMSFLCWGQGEHDEVIFVLSQKKIANEALLYN